MTRVIEVEEDGTLTLPSDIIGYAKPHTQYVVEAESNLLTLRPVTVKPARSKKPRSKRNMSLQMWEEERRRLTEELRQVWPEGVSVEDVISEMRR